MAKRKPLKTPRKKAFFRQDARCYYCHLPMWLDDPVAFSQKFKITIKQAKNFQCTGEHLIAHKDQGSSSKKNIVAACLFCNHKRHARKNELTLGQYKSLVSKRVARGLWNNSVLDAKSYSKLQSLDKPMKLKEYIGE